MEIKNIIQIKQYNLYKIESKYDYIIFKIEYKI